VHVVAASSPASPWPRLGPLPPLRRRPRHASCFPAPIAPLASLPPPSRHRRTDCTSARVRPPRGRSPSHRRRKAAGGEESDCAVGADGSSTAGRRRRQAAVLWAPAPSPSLAGFLLLRCLCSLEDVTATGAKDSHSGLVSICFLSPVLTYTGKR
jgi:hypothetical protein